MSGIVISPDQMKDVKIDNGIPISPSQMKDVKFVGDATPKTSGSSKAQSRKWSDVPKEALKNAIPSLGRTAENIGSGLLHPLDTAESVMRGVSGGLDLGLRALGLHPSHLYMNPDEYRKDIETAHAIGSHLAGRYGSGEAFRNTMATDPAGFVLDALPFAGSGLRALGVGGLLAKGAEALPAPIRMAGEMAKKGGKAVLSAPGKSVAQTLGRMTGAGPEAVAESVKGRPGFVKQMRGNADTEEELANDALKRLSDLKAARSAKYESDLAGLGNAPLDTSPMVGHFVNRMKKENVSVNAASRKLDFSRSSLGEDEGLPHLERAHQLFRTAWQKKNIGLQEAIVLKHQVGNLLNKTKPGTRANAVMIDLKNGIDKVLTQHPGYRKMNRDYAVQSGRIDQAEKAFSLKQARRKNIQTILTKMQTHARRHNQFARSLIEKLDPSGDLTAQMYGLEMKPWFRRGLETPLLWGEGGAAAVTHSATLPGIGLGLIGASSPRLVGEAGNLLGKTARGASALAERSRLPASGLLALLEEQGALANGQ